MGSFGGVFLRGARSRSVGCSIVASFRLGLAGNRGPLERHRLKRTTAPLVHNWGDACETLPGKEYVLYYNCYNINYNIRYTAHKTVTV